MPSTQRAMITPGRRTTRSATPAQKPDIGSCSRLSVSKSAPRSWCGCWNGQKTAPRSQCSRTGARVNAATSPIARLSAIAGPVYWILAKLENQSIPRPTITVPALATRAPPTFEIASRNASSRPRPRTSSSR